ncbi:MFS transporter [Nakamurella sp.]|uniref:MFS transporter n=1 Tax=Nakamurella sp. TaxID=1869182 RepID=UPI00378407A4
MSVRPLSRARPSFQIGAYRTAGRSLSGSLIGACLDPGCGQLADRDGAGWVLRTGLLVTLLGFAAMSAAWAFDLSGTGTIGVAALIIVALGYPFDYIGGTMLAAQLTLDGQGWAMGLSNSAVAAGAIVGAVVPSFLAREFGYGSLPPMAAVVLLGALVVGWPVLRSRSRSPRAVSSVGPASSGAVIPRWHHRAHVRPLRVDDGTGVAVRHLRRRTGRAGRRCPGAVRR